MPNELLLILSIVLYYGMLLIWFRFFGKQGLISFTVLATIAANIEVLILVNAFGMEQTLGNVMFASTFLVTDIMSEVYGKEAAKKAVNAGIATSISFILITQFWLLFTPGVNDWAFESIKSVFSNTPRMMISSLVVYVITQRFDVWAYHKWWAFTEKISGDHHKFLWVRNNGSTLISQLLNTFLYTIFAFWGTYDVSTIISIVVSSYIIFIFTSLSDTPAIYAARYMAEKRQLD